MRNLARRPLLVFLLLSSLLAPALVSGDVLRARLLLDTDVDAGTGCDIHVDEVAHATGPFQGVEHVLTVVLDVDVPVPRVARVYRQRCLGTSMGPVVAILPGGWAVGIGTGVSGGDVVEGQVLLADLGSPGSARVAFSVEDETVPLDVLGTQTGGPGGGAIVVSLASPLPGLGTYGALALVAILSGLSFRFLLRGRTSRPAAIVGALLIGGLAAGGVRGALDGQVGDWLGIAPAATDSVGDSLGGPSSDLLAGFVRAQGGVLHVRVDLDAAAAACSVAVDADFDGANECVDCNDADGSVFPGAPEVCNGRDDDCDLAVDEDFDGDLDGWTICDDDPRFFDCNDALGSISPAAAEVCANGVDENCDGYADLGCPGCDLADPDLDGVSECGGDCAPGNGTSYPGAPEICDGLDNDCHVSTTENCGSADACNWPGGGDVCIDGLFCSCILNGSGVCTGNYACGGFCNSSATGLPGDGCAADQICSFSALYTANLGGCSVSPVVPGTKQPAEVCASDVECRSASCARLCVGPGCANDYCLDHCASDAYCTAAGTVCRIERATLHAQCWPSALPAIGATAVGAACASDGVCDHGFCSTTTGQCTEACCSDSDCPGGFSCSLQGDFLAASVVYEEPTAPNCNVNADCATDFCFNGKCVYELADTVGQCVPDLVGQGARTAGAACTQNADCRSQFCEVDLGICLETCCDDAGCPSGFACRRQHVETRAASGGAPSRASRAKICVSAEREEVWRRL